MKFHHCCTPMENIFWPTLENSTIALQERNFRRPCARNAKFIFPSAGGVGCNMGCGVQGVWVWGVWDAIWGVGCRVCGCGVCGVQYGVWGAGVCGVQYAI